MNSKFNEILATEIESDWLSALLRVGVFLVLVATVFAAAIDTDLPHHTIMDVGLYGIATLVNVVLALKSIYRPWLPYLFATFDVILVVFHMRALSSIMGFGADLYILPSSLIMLLILIHASMRFQPWLIAYIASLFILTIVVAAELNFEERTISMSGRMHDMAISGHRMMADVFVGDLFPPIILAMASLILVLGNLRARRFLLTAIDQASRTSRLSRFFSPEIAKNLEITDL